MWWFDVPVEKLTSGKHSTIDLLVFDSEAKQLHHLQVQTKYISGNLERFRIRIREGKAFVSLEISSQAGNQFQDVRPKSGRMPFAQFLVRTASLGNER